MAKFKVLRRHQGDRFYEEGDEREARESDVQHLIPNTLDPISAKAEPAPKNKAEPAPKNKAVSAPKNKADK